MAFAARTLAVLALVGPAFLPAQVCAGVDSGDPNAGGFYFDGIDRVAYAIRTESGDSLTHGSGREAARLVESFVVVTESPMGWARESGPLDGLCLACTNDPADGHGSALGFYEDEQRQSLALSALEAFGKRVSGETIAPLTVADVEMTGVLHRKARPYPRIDHIRGTVRLVMSAGTGIVLTARARHYGVESPSGVFASSK